MTPYLKQKCVDIACILPLLFLVAIAANVYPNQMAYIVGFGIGVAYALGDTFGKKFYGGVL
jgi:hypothetical protein